MVDFHKMLEHMKTDEYKQEKLLEEKQEEERVNLIKQTACFTGHRPNKLGGYDMKNPIIIKLKNKLVEEVLPILIEHEKIAQFISGGALGVDTIAFYCVHIIKEQYPNIKNILAIPFKNQDKIWSQEQKYWYQRMIKLVDRVVNVEEINEYQTNSDVPLGKFSKEKMQKRNEYMVDNSRIVVAVFDGSKGGTANCMRYTYKMGKSIYKIYPQYDFQFEVVYGWNG